MKFPKHESPPKAFTRVPPAIFPSILGLLGLGLAWRRASEAYGKSSAISDLILGATLILLVVGLTAYGLKFLKRPSVLIDDLRVHRFHRSHERPWFAGMHLCTPVLSRHVSFSWETND